MDMHVADTWPWGLLEGACALVLLIQSTPTRCCGLMLAMQVYPIDAPAGTAVQLEKVALADWLRPMLFKDRPKDAKSVAADAPGPGPAPPPPTQAAGPAAAADAAGQSDSRVRDSATSTDSSAQSEAQPTSLLATGADSAAASASSITHGTNAAAVAEGEPAPAGAARRGKRGLLRALLQEVTLQVLTPWGSCVEKV